MTTLTDDIPLPPGAPEPPSTDALGSDLELPATPGLVWLALAVGALCDLAGRSGVVSIGGALFLAGASVALLCSGRLRTGESRLLVAAAPLFGTWLALRTSDWLLPLDTVAAVGLLVLGTSLSSGGSLFDLTVPAAGRRLAEAALHGLQVPGFLRPMVQRSGARVARHGAAIPAVRGLALAVPIVAVFGALLASADAVFASMFRVDIDSSGLVLHAVLVIVGAWLVLGLLRTASAQPLDPHAGATGHLGRTEVTVVLGSVVLLFGAFSVSQLVALSDGGQRVLDTSGLTYAEYARSGFFQLLWVAALTVALLLSLRAMSADDAATHRRFTWLAEAVVVLTLGIVVVAVRRLELYQDAFGLTMLRLYCTIFALWVGAVILGLAATLGELWPSRSWLLGAATVAGLAALLALNIANPEAVVARHNLDRLAQGREVDDEYLAEGLSLDAVPTIVDRLPSLDDNARRDLLERIGCPEPADGWAAWNRSHAAAITALGDDCIPTPEHRYWD